ncbi:MAG TPA: amino acid ABC transporter substrate-binding protein [Burkholderiaceae bacterium]|nr:amino acid ABC transporter substrate-binding protein [Burkholderiaceae bacterium]
MQRVRRRLVRAAGSLVRLLIAFAAMSIGAVAAQTAEPPVRIGVSLGLSGAYQEIAELQRNAYRLWVRHVNESGGLAGRRVELVIRDDQSNPETARSIYEDFIVRDKLDFVFGPYSSAITAAVVPLTEAHRYPLLAAGAASDELWKRGYTHLLGTIAPAGRYTIGFLAILAQAGLKEFAIVSADDAFSVSLADGARRWAPEYGLKVTSSQEVPKGTPNLERAATAARASGAQALLMAGHFEESVTMRRALNAIGWTPNVFYASVGPGLDAYKAAVGADAEGTFSTSVWEAREDLKLPGSAEFLRAFIDAYGQKPSYQAAQAYAAGQILAHAVKKAGGVDRAAVRDALFKLDTNVLIGRFVVDRTGSQTKRFPLIIQWQRGQREIVWPPELRTAEAITARR